MLGVTALLLASTDPTSAASFNCAAATTPREHLICDTPSLSAADDQMAKLYAVALSAVSGKSRSALRAGQRSWLRYLAAICPETVAKDTAAWTTPVACLTNNYASRSRELETAVQRLGPFLFVRFDHYEAIVKKLPHPQPMSIFAVPEIVDTEILKVHFAYPQIDQPLTPATTRWNELHVRGRLNQGDCDADENSDYSITLATPDLISVTLTDWFYCYPAPHGYGLLKAENLMLSPAPHPMQPGDLFRKDVDWAKRLRVETGDGVDQAAKDDGYPKESLDRMNRSAIDSAAADPTRWRLTPDGLVLIFQEYELNLGYKFVPQITVRWTEMKDILQPHLHLPSNDDGK